MQIFAQTFLTTHICGLGVDVQNEFQPECVTLSNV